MVRIDSRNRRTYKNKKRKTKRRIKKRTIRQRGGSVHKVFPVVEGVVVGKSVEPKGSHDTIINEWKAAIEKARTSEKEARDSEKEARDSEGKARASVDYLHENIKLNTPIKEYSVTFTDEGSLGLVFKQIILEGTITMSEIQIDKITTGSQADNKEHLTSALIPYLVMNNVGETSVVGLSLPDVQDIITKSTERPLTLTFEKLIGGSDRERMEALTEYINELKARVAELEGG
jgi:hypothetical protein